MCGNRLHAFRRGFRVFYALTANRARPHSLGLGLSGGYRLQIEGLWRLLADGSLARTGEDDGQSFGHKSPVDAISDLSVGLIGCALHSVEVVPGTADLILSFGHHVLQVVSNSSGYEAWQVEGPQGTVAVGQGGGKVAVWG